MRLSQHECKTVAASVLFDECSRKHGRRKDIFQGGNSEFIQGSKGFFPGGPTVMEFHVTNFETKIKTIFY